MLQRTRCSTNNESTEDVQPLVVQVQSRNPISEPVVAPVSAPMPNQSNINSISFKKNMNEKRLREKANDKLRNLTEPLPPPPNHKDYSPGIRKELKICEAKTVKSSIDEPPEDEEKAALIKVSKVPQATICWKLSDIKVLIQSFVLTNSIMERNNNEPRVQVKDGPWVSPVHCVPKKGGITVVKNDDNDLIPTRLVTGWRVCIDYRKLNEAPKRSTSPLPLQGSHARKTHAGTPNSLLFPLDGFSCFIFSSYRPKDQGEDNIPCPIRNDRLSPHPFGLCKGNAARFNDV
ncbi:hypothetical protein Tco_1071078 [Tanacetum coccineum]|uniref:Reverse transcriptase domain-containing protein n=1 Tax=Tanacetum coccineum TaxID=301880 RepID=A0ABQ5HN94_9ASTR